MVNMFEQYYSNGFWCRWWWLRGAKPKWVLRWIWAGVLNTFIRVYDCSCLLLIRCWCLSLWGINGTCRQYSLAYQSPNSLLCGSGDQVGHWVWMGEFAPLRADYSLVLVQRGPQRIEYTTDPQGMLLLGVSIIDVDIPRDCQCQRVREDSMWAYMGQSALSPEVKRHPFADNSQICTPSAH